MTRTVAIVGGGISGLAAAEALSRRDSELRPIVLESEATAGGKIDSRREQGFVIDTGPHGFLDKEPKMFELIDRLGLNGSLIKADEASERRFVMRDGVLREVPSSPPAFLASSILPFFAKLRVLLEPFARGRPEGEESVWDFAARRIGKVAADRLVDAMVTGVYAGDPKRLSLPATFPRMYELESEYGGLIKAQLALAKQKQLKGGGPTGSMCSFDDGLGVLIRALIARTEVRTGAEVERIEQSGGRWLVRHRGGSIEADAVVLAVPAFTAERLLAPLLPEPARILGGVPYADVAVVIQAFAREDVAGDVAAFGFLVPGIERRPILGTILASSVFPQHAPPGTVMLRTILGGVRHPENAGGDDDALFLRARSELEQLFAIRRQARPLLQRVLRWKNGIPQYELGHAARVAAADEVERALPGMFVIGNAFRGVAMLNCVAEADRLALRALERIRARSSTAA